MENKRLAFINPAGYFKNPYSVISAKEFTQKEKRTILENWKDSCVHLDESQEEGMAGKESYMLKEVNDVLRQLKDNTRHNLH